MLFKTGYTHGSKPTNPKEGDLYYDYNTGSHYTFNNGNWLELKFILKNLDRKKKIKSILK